MSSPAFDITSPLSDLVETTLKEGPQVVTKDGVETAVLVSIEDWQRLQPRSVSRHVDALSDPNGPHDLYIPPHPTIRLRPVDLSD